MKKEHHYNTTITWTGNNGTGTSGYADYGRNHTLSIEGKADIMCSSDPYFRGDASRINPEEMLLSALSSCHMLWYLHFCADNGIIVTAYSDNAKGTMAEKNEGGGHFTEVTLYPHVTITDASKIELANALHHKANEKCFIANSCNFPVNHAPTCTALS